MVYINIIAGVSEHTRGIGYNNSMPWGKLSGDMKHFKKITDNSVIIMGRNTWDSLPYKPLKNRINIVISKKLDRNIGEEIQPFILDSLENAIQFAYSNFQNKNIFIIGGSKLYETAIHMKECTRLFLTIINHEKNQLEYDCFFPYIPIDYELVEESDMMIENDYKYKFVTYLRK